MDSAFDLCMSVNELETPRDEDHQNCVSVENRVRRFVTLESQALAPECYFEVSRKRYYRIQPPLCTHTLALVRSDTTRARVPSAERSSLIGASSSETRTASNLERLSL